MTDEGFEERKSSSRLHMCCGCFNLDWCIGWLVCTGRILTCFNQWSIIAAFGMARLQLLDLTLLVKTLLLVLSTSLCVPLLTSRVYHIARFINHIANSSITLRPFFDTWVCFCRSLIVSGIIVLLLSEKIALMLPRSLRRVLKPKAPQQKPYIRTAASSSTRRDGGASGTLHVKVSSS